MRQFGIKEGILLAFASRIILDPTMEAKGGKCRDILEEAGHVNVKYIWGTL
jgi:hypothetical protein